ncbi:MAG: YIP1 family protein [Defluviitaleaceae bacterium]|nr:YIP1 family protein [Defluviitaleaceae bacterium]MCL2240271.1 YIP1 family protein [Defluviitaleaceae bacterium]
MIKRIFGFYALPMRIIARPFAGFYAMKFEEKGTVRLALFNFFLVLLSFAFSNQFASILVDERHPLTINSVSDAFFLIATLLLFCVANWSVTALTDGEGRFKDIVMAVCYAMTPLVLTIVPATILSNFLSAEETGLYFLLMGAGVFYFVLLVFVGLLTVHNYGAVKMVITLLLTIVSILVIVFLLTLTFTLFQQLYSFLYSVYTEIIFRI